MARGAIVSRAVRCVTGGALGIGRHRYVDRIVTSSAVEPVGVRRVAGETIGVGCLRLVRLTMTGSAVGPFVVLGVASGTGCVGGRRRMSLLMAFGAIGPFVVLGVAGQTGRIGRLRSVLVAVTRRTVRSSVVLLVTGQTFCITRAGVLGRSQKPRIVGRRISGLSGHRDGTRHNQGGCADKEDEKSEAYAHEMKSTGRSPAGHTAFRSTTRPTSTRHHPTNSTIRRKDLSLRPVPSDRSIRQVSPICVLGRRAYFKLGSAVSQWTQGTGSHRGRNCGLGH
jgi:hypothetical protein